MRVEKAAWPSTSYLRERVMGGISEWILLKGGGDVMRGREWY